MIYTVSNSLQKGIGFFVFMYLAGFLSTSEYAKFGLNYSLFSIISGLSAAGIYESIISNLNEHKNRSGELFKAGNSVFIILSSTSFLFIFFLVPFFFESQFNSIVQYVILAIGAILISFFTYQSIVIRLREEYSFSVILSFVPMLFSYIGGFIGVFYLEKESGYFLGSLVGIIIILLCLLPLLIKKNILFSKDKEIVFSIIYRIVPYIIIAVLMWLSGYGNSYVINYFFKDSDVATFVFLFTISSILQLVGSSMNQVWTPKFYNDYTHYAIEELERRYNRFTVIQGFVIGFAGLCIIVLSSFIFKAFQGFQKFENTHYELFFLFLGYVVSIPWWHHQNYYMINNKGKVLMNITLISSIIGYIIWVLCMFLLGRIGIYLGFFLQMFTRSMLVYIQAYKYWKIRSDWEGISIGTGVLLLSLFIIFIL